ncbi:MAG: hypothetical protein HYV32_04325 [Candidatus Kerfeldbacteria bacterium]|nr:hypothetical protein [Candidatus Kerfeldbacteria bacterium]
MPEQPQPISEKKLRMGYWIATHRQLIHTSYRLFWGLIAAISIGIFLFNAVNWAAHIQQTNQIWETISTPIYNLGARQNPKSLIPIRTEAVVYNDTSVDIVSDIRNPNTIWSAQDVEYEIFLNGSSTGVDHTTFAPEQEKMVTKMRIPFTGGTPTARIEITHVEWKKTVGDDAVPQAAWNVTNTALRTVQSTEKDALFQTSLQFTIQNESVYGFREPEVVAILTDEEGRIQAIGRASLTQIDSLQTIDRTMYWEHRLPTTLQPKIVVNVDLLTEDRIIRHW